MKDRIILIALFSLVSLTALSQGDIDTVSVTITKPIWFGIIQKSAVSYLIRHGGSTFTSNIPRRTAIFGERHKLVIKDGVIDRRKETSYTIKLPDFHCNVRVSGARDRDRRSAGPITIINSPVTVELVGVIKEHLAGCYTTKDNEVARNLLRYFYSYEVMSTQTVYKDIAGSSVRPCMRQETYIPNLMSSTGKKMFSASLGGDLSRAHLHYLLHSLFIGGGGFIPAPPRLTGDLGYNIEAERYSRVIDGNEVSDSMVSQEKIDFIVRHLDSEADRRWYEGIAKGSSSITVTAGDRFQPGATCAALFSDDAQPRRIVTERYNDDLLATNCNARIVRVNVSTAGVPASPGVIIVMHDTDDAVMVFDNSYGEEVGDGDKVDSSLGSRLSGLSQHDCINPLYDITGVSPGAGAAGSATGQGLFPGHDPAPWLHGLQPGSLR